jgi:hypothetical protein
VLLQNIEQTQETIDDHEESWLHRKAQTMLSHTRWTLGDLRYSAFYARAAKGSFIMAELTSTVEEEDDGFTLQSKEKRGQSGLTALFANLNATSTGRRKDTVMQPESGQYCDGHDGSPIRG